MDDLLRRPTRRADNRQTKREYERDAGPSAARVAFATTDMMLLAGLELPIATRETVFLQTGDDCRIVSRVPQCVYTTRLHGLASVFNFFRRGWLPDKVSVCVRVVEDCEEFWSFAFR
jgi:hypothetical protein